MATDLRFLVTGAAGFVGARLCRILAEIGEVHAVTGAASDAWRLNGEDRLVRYAIDVRDAAAVRRVVLAARPSVIYNLASHGAYPHQTDATRILETNVLGLTNLLQACDAVEYTLFLHAGSSSEYGRKAAPMTETHELIPESVYGVSKVAQSLLCREWSRAQDRPIVVFRLFSVYGPFEEPTRLIPRLLTALLDDTPLALVAPRTSRDFVYVDDVVAAFRQIDRLAGLAGSILNLGTGVQTSLAEVVAAAESVAGRTLRAAWNTMPPRSWDTDTWVADTTALRRSLDWVPSVTVREGLARSLAWLRENRKYYPAARQS